MQPVPVLLVDTACCRQLTGTGGNWAVFFSSELFILQPPRSCNCLPEYVALLPMQALSLFPLKVNVGELLIDHLMLSQPELSGQIFVQHCAESCISKNTSTFRLFTFTHLLNHACPQTNSSVVDKEYVFSTYFCTQTWSLLQICLHHA